MKIWSTISDALERHGKCAMITMLTVEGSAPREAGARMIVMPDNTFTGTIGGGALEWRALALAQMAMRKADMTAEISRHALGPELGQCCGGATQAAHRNIQRWIVSMSSADLICSRSIRTRFRCESRQVDPQGVQRNIVEIEDRQQPS